MENIKFLAKNFAPNPLECTHWVDLTEDPQGKVIKTYNHGYKRWETIKGRLWDSDLEKIEELDISLQEVFNTYVLFVEELYKKVDVVEGKSLSDNNYTTVEKNKLNGIQTGANKTTVLNSLTSTSSTEALAAVQGKNLNDLIVALTARVAALETQPEA